MANRMPRLPPVTITLAIGARQFPAGRYRELIDDGNAGGNFVRRQICPTERRNFMRDRFIFTALIDVQHDVRLDKCTGDGVLARAHP